MVPTAIDTQDGSTQTAELWKSDGTAAGTTQILSGSNSFSDPDRLTQVGPSLFFVDDGTGALWVTDGLPSGTNELTTGIGASDLTRVGDELFFVDAAGTVYRSDGTPSGTGPVPSAGEIQAADLTAVGNKLFFLDETGALRTTDGTATLQILPPGASFTPGASLTAAGNSLFLIESSGQIWISDGTSDGTHSVVPDSGTFSAPDSLTPVEGKVYFVDLGTGALWTSDGTAAGTTIVTEQVFAGDLVGVRNTLFFIDENTGELWKSDGTGNGTVPLTSSATGPDAGLLTAVGDKLYFVDDNTGALWVSDGTSAGTTAVTQANGSAFDAKNLSDVNGTLYFQAFDPVHGTELWTTDGTSAGTHVVDVKAGLGPEPQVGLYRPLATTSATTYVAGPDANGDAFDLFPVDGGMLGAPILTAEDFDFATSLGATLFFTTNDPATGEPQLGKSDGTAAGTVAIAPTTGALHFPGPLVSTQDAVYFADLSNGQLWKTDGNELVPIAVSAGGDGGAGPISHLTPVGNDLYFATFNGIGKVDGVTSIETTITGGFILPSSFTPLDNSIFFIAASSTAHDGRPLDGPPALWKLDGNTASEITPAAGRIDYPTDLIAAGPNVYFITVDATTHETSLWKSDGTSGGTAEIGGNFSLPTFLLPLGTEAYFTAADGDGHPFTLWKTDGTTATEIFSGAVENNEASPIVVGNTLYFVSDGELWDTKEGSASAAQVTSDQGSFVQVSDLVVEGSDLYFDAYDVSHGNQLWRTDGTPSGTMPVTHSTEPNSSFPKDITAGPHDTTAVVDASSSSAVAFTFSAAVAGFDSADVTVTGGTLGTLNHLGLNDQNEDVYTAAFLPAAPGGTGSIQVTGVYADLAGNAGSASNVALVTATHVNNSPVLASAAPTLTTITEDDTDNADQTVASIIGSTITDVDDAAAQGIAVTGAANGNGHWQYSHDSGATWTAFGAVSASAALLLDGDDEVRFVPDARNGTLAGFTYRAWDETTGAPGARADTTTSGGISAFSTNANTASITVSSVNDPPVANPDTDSVGENQTKSFDVLANDSDVDTGDTKTLDSPLAAVMVTGANAAIDGIGASGAFAVVDNQILFTPGASFDALAANQVATVVVNYTMHDSQGSAASSALALTVNGVNDAPVLADVTPSEAYAPGGRALILSPNLTVADIDDSSLRSATVVASGNGTPFLGDVLAIDGVSNGTLPDYPNLSVTDSTQSGTLTLTGPDTPADFSAALRTVTFQSDDATPTDGRRSPRRF